MYELAIDFGTTIKSKQTGFIHWYRGKDEGVHDTIPILENFCYAFSLLRSRNKETIEKAKEHLEKILPFQLENGNFPIYLHEFPVSKSLCLPLFLLSQIYWIQEEYYHLLGDSLKQKLKNTADKLFSFAKDNREYYSAPFCAAI